MPLKEDLVHVTIIGNPDATLCWQLISVAEEENEKTTKKEKTLWHYINDWNKKTSPNNETYGTPNKEQKRSHSERKMKEKTTKNNKLCHYSNIWKQQTGNKPEKSTKQDNSINQQ